MSSVDVIEGLWVRECGLLRILAVTLKIWEHSERLAMHFPALDTTMMVVHGRVLLKAESKTESRPTSSIDVLIHQCCSMQACMIRDQRHLCSNLSRFTIVTCSDGLCL